MAVLGRAIFYTLAGLSMAIFPRTSHLYETGGNHRKLFFQVLPLGLVIMVVAVLFFWLWGRPVINILFQGKYPDAALYVTRFTIARGFFGLSYFSP
jgi:O-antigen/teichoic acid export membrane protein